MTSAKIYLPLAIIISCMIYYDTGHVNSLGEWGMGMKMRSMRKGIPLHREGGGWI